MDRDRSNESLDANSSAKRAMGERIAQERREMSARERRDVTRAEVAQAVGVDPGSVTKWEKGEVAPADGALIRLARYFGVTRGWLRYGEEPRYPPPSLEAPAPEPVDPPAGSGEPEDLARVRQHQRSRSGRHRR